ncbi:Pimeloyl-ACP methyl ester carboxylesterase [Paenibacillus sp. UNC496MF]|uniref:alpha/beta fold hydrolase n=1 Tax=Paenibacillus sp. UNC496MF TaxID=1502753 RepID=UPI0008ED4B25|nr:alpha/beta hydrolase [Paenibacillus sp. UNC496MF]SFJ87368.1 Pimeloyl-ACP methyl ester carboxylesterase [Paenibacillus sp. UNC496MF]
MREFRINGIHIRDTGGEAPGTGETLVLLHGLGWDMGCWETLLPLFPASYRIVMIDLRGHGQSEGDNGRPSWHAFVWDVRRIADRLGLETFHLAGYGFGANLAIKYSAADPGQVRRLMLMAPVVLLPREVIGEMVRTRKTLLERQSIRGLARYLAEQLTAQPAGGRTFRRVEQAFAAMDPDRYLEMLALYLDAPTDYDYRSIRHPVLTLVGEFDELNAASYALTLRFLRDSRVVVVPGAANAVFLDQPEAAAKLMADFMTANFTAPAGDEGPFAARPERRERRSHESGSDGGARIRADFLGGFRIRIDGEERHEGWNQRYAKSLLLFLVLNRAATREQICDALFPDKPLKRALANLKVYLNHLKKLLEPSGSARQEASGMLAVDKDHIRLIGPVESDLLQLMQAVQAVQREEEPGAKLKRCRDAVLNVPETLLPGLFDDWIADVRSGLEAQLIALAAEAARLEEARGNLAGSLYFLQKASLYQPEDESLFEQTLRLADHMLQARR